MVCRVAMLVVICLAALLGWGCEAAFAPQDAEEPSSREDGDTDLDEPEAADSEEDEELAEDGDVEEPVYTFYFTQAAGRVGESVRTALYFADAEAAYAALHLDEDGYPAYWFNWGDRYIQVERLDFDEATPAFSRIDLVLTVGTRTGSHDVLLHLVHVTDTEYKIIGKGNFLVLPNQAADGDSQSGDDDVDGPEDGDLEMDHEEPHDPDGDLDQEEGFPDGDEDV